MITYLQLTDNSIFVTLNNISLGYWAPPHIEILPWCCDTRALAACAQSFTLWQQEIMKATRRAHSVIACSRHVHTAAILGAHLVRGVSPMRRHVDRAASTLVMLQIPSDLNMSSTSFYFCQTQLYNRFSSNRLLHMWSFCNYASVIQKISEWDTKNGRKKSQGKLV